MTGTLTIIAERDYYKAELAKRDAEIAELKTRMVDGVTVQQYIDMDNEVDALKAEMEQLTKKYEALQQAYGLMHGGSK